VFEGRTMLADVLVLPWKCGLRQCACCDSLALQPVGWGLHDNP
jgi:hypothetical protein